MIWGRPPGERAPPLNQSSKKKEAGAEGRGEHHSTNGHKCLSSQETGREGEHPATIMGSEETGCSPGLKEMVRGSLQHPALRWWNGVGEEGHLWPCKGRGQRKEALGISEEWEAPLAPILIDIKDIPSQGIYERTSTPSAWSCLSNGGQENRWSSLPCPRPLQTWLALLHLNQSLLVYSFLIHNGILGLLGYKYLMH